MNRAPFAVVVSRKDRLSVAGSAELCAKLLPEHSPHAILPASWNARIYAGRILDAPEGAPSDRIADYI